MKVKILPDTNRYFQVGSSMKDRDKIKMLLFLIQNVDMFDGIRTRFSRWTLNSLFISLMWILHSFIRNRS